MSIDNHKNSHDSEQAITKKIFDNIVHAGCLNDAHIDFLLSPKSAFNGDVLLAARKPNGDMHVLLGDFTGHGLPAAIGALPTATIFYAMTAKGFGLLEVLTEINAKLSTILPTGRFCAAAMFAVSRTDQTLHIWNGGLPAGFIQRTGLASSARLPSANIPLGIIGDNIDKYVQKEQFEPGDRCLLYSDGIIEAQNPDGEMFGEQRLIELVEHGAYEGRFSTQIQRALREFHATNRQQDDITLLEYLA